MSKVDDEAPITEWMGVPIGIVSDDNLREAYTLAIKKACGYYVEEMQAIEYLTSPRKKPLQMVEAINHFCETMEKREDRTWRIVVGIANELQLRGYTINPLEGK